MTNTKEKIPACPAAGKCGGCAYQGIPYEEQLQKKKEQVRRLLRDICPVRAAVGMEDPYHYRNKVHAAFGRLRDGRIVSGIYQEGTHKIVPVDSCLIEDQTADFIRDIWGLLPPLRSRSTTRTAATACCATGGAGASPPDRCWWRWYGPHPALQK